MWGRRLASLILGLALLAAQSGSMVAQGMEGGDAASGSSNNAGTVDLGGKAHSFGGDGGDGGSSPSGFEGGN